MYSPSATCPLVSSQGRTVLDLGRPYLWIPSRWGGRPIFLDSEEAILKLEIDESKAEIAAEEHLSLIHI